ncbi:DUF3122 domain-containing protein [Pleurocapsales cyanobacterium LEGE 06147]|nr:DUF3122 domain-containing protein [Pleurocapsales cyanobacterium LEGE 06147]
MGCRIREFSAKLVLVGTIILLIFIGLDNFNTQLALASIRQMEEAPRQILIQSRHTLQDEQGDSWQVVLFKRFFADGSTIINLRLVDFPGKADFAHPQPLQVSTNKGDLFEAEDMFAQKSPAPNVGQFDVKDILSQLPITKLNLSLGMKGDRSTNLSIPPEVVLEWKSVATQS